MKTIRHYFVVGVGVYLGWTFAYSVDCALGKRYNRRIRSWVDKRRKENNHAEN
jgi:hypothetical protein